MRRWFGEPQPALEEKTLSLTRGGGGGRLALRAEPGRRELRPGKAGFGGYARAYPFLNEIGQGIADIFTKRRLDDASLDDLEDILIQADLGSPPRPGFAKRSHAADMTGRSRRVKPILADEIERALGPVARPLAIDRTKSPYVILVVGVNGSGKTTTIGKLAAKFAPRGKRSCSPPATPFAPPRSSSCASGRGAPAPMSSSAPGRRRRRAGLRRPDARAGERRRRADGHRRAAAKPHGAHGRARKDHPGDEKVDPDAPHAVLLVLDATVGQNAMNQVEIFGHTRASPDSS